MNNYANFIVDDDDVPALRAIMSHIIELGFCEVRVRERLGLPDIAEIFWRALPIYRVESLAVRDELALLIDLFLLQGAASVAELDKLFTKEAQAVLLRVGLIFIDEQGVVRAMVSLFPVGGQLIFSDHAWPTLPHPGLSKISPDQVMSVGTDSRWLARATVRKSINAALDLCTGSGIQALLAAPHSRRVVAVDINPRAAHCTRFNAQASGADNVAVLAGDLYEFIGAERFDLITANPPFVPSPVESLRFRDGGHSGEDVQRRIIEGLPRHLAEGGIAQIVMEFGEREGEELAERLREWLGGAPMDILILRMRVHSAASYAIGHANGDESYDIFFDSVNEWAENLRVQGYAGIVSVLLAFQWSDPALGESWIRSEELQSLHGDGGNELEAIFAAERMARQTNLPELLERSLICRTGAVGLMESRVLGSEQFINIQAKVMGRVLPIIQRLDSVERDVLILIEKPLKLSEILELSHTFNLDKEIILVALRSLIRKGFIFLADTPL